MMSYDSKSFKDNEVLLWKSTRKMYCEMFMTRDEMPTQFNLLHFSGTVFLTQIKRKAEKGNGKSQGVFTQQFHSS